MEVSFNPSCSTCRSARDHLEEAGVEFTLRRYLDDPPTEAELRRALAALGLEPWDITRMSDPLARELHLAEGPGTPTRGSGCSRSIHDSSSVRSCSPTTAGRGSPGTTTLSPRCWRPGGVRPRTLNGARHDPSPAAAVHAETAAQKVRLAEDGWNTRDPEKVAAAYTVDSRWRNRAES